MSDDTNVFTVTDHFVETVFDRFLSQIIGPFLAGLCECLLLALVPIFFGLIYENKMSILFHHTKKFKVAFLSSLAF